MHTASSVWTTLQVQTLVKRLTDAGGQYVCNLNTGSTVTVSGVNGTLAMRAVSPLRNKWSVQVSERVAVDFRIPLWKDM